MASQHCSTIYLFLAKDLNRNVWSFDLKSNRHRSIVLCFSFIFVLFFKWINMTKNHMWRYTIHKSVEKQFWNYRFASYFQKNIHVYLHPILYNGLSIFETQIQNFSSSFPPHSLTLHWNRSNNTRTWTMNLMSRFDKKEINVKKQKKKIITKMWIKRYREHKQSVMKWWKRHFLFYLVTLEVSFRLYRIKVQRKKTVPHIVTFQWNILLWGFISFYISFQP